MRPLVLGTAGHIDHGKTTLVRALTGIDTDRLPDEKRRGITIDLGFAQLTLPDGRRLGIVDVPGHEAFVRNMLAGATGMDLVLLVVAADEGPMPQTREHLGIIDLLGIRHGVVVITRVDLVEPDWLELVRNEVRETLAPTSLSDAPIVDVSATTGVGMEDLRVALAAAAARTVDRSDADDFRMPIDRVFTVHGTGTVATGTVWTGSLHRDEVLRILPSGMSARVRGLQQHGNTCDAVQAGARAAIALAGVDREALTRGDTLVTGSAWKPSGALTLQLRLLHDAPAPIRSRQRVRVHIGTSEVMGRVAIPGGGELLPGDSTLAQLRLERPVVARAGDRVVLRSYSPVHTVGGGTVLEPAAPRRKHLTAEVEEALRTIERRYAAGVADAGTAHDRDDPACARPSDAMVLAAAVALAGPAGLDGAVLPLLTGLPEQRTTAAIRDSASLALIGDRVLFEAPLRLLEDRILLQIARFHDAKPLLDGIERDTLRRELGDPPLLDHAVARMLADRRLATAGNTLALPGHAATPTGQALAAMKAIAERFAAAALEPPELTHLPAELTSRPDFALLIRFLERDGTLIRLSPARLVSARAVSDAIAAARSQLAPGQTLTIADFRDVLGLTRKHLIPLLEYFDRSGVTRRDGEARILVDA